MTPRLIRNVKYKTLFWKFIFSNNIFSIFLRQIWHSRKKRLDDDSIRLSQKYQLIFLFLSTFLVLGDRPSSQMSFLEQFLKESTSGGRSREPISVPPGSRLDRSIAELSSASGAGARRGYSVESDEGDVEDNHAVSNASSRSNMSELSAVSQHFFAFPCVRFLLMLT